jgi:hypothetical protein
MGMSARTSVMTRERSPARTYGTAKAASALNRVVGLYRSWKQQVRRLTHLCEARPAIFPIDQVE